MPPGWGHSVDGRTVRVWGNTSLTVSREIPAPLASAEIVPWTKPSAAVCFPLHPAGALALYARALGLMDATHDPLQTSQEVIGAALWRAVLLVYIPGQSIRAQIDAAVADREWCGRHAIDDPVLAQVAQLAGWLVVRAAIEWAGDVS